MIHHPAELLLNEMEQQVLAALSASEATSIDAHRGGDRPAGAQVLATLSVLEMRHLIRRLSGTTGDTTVEEKTKITKARKNEGPKQGGGGR